MEPKCPKCGASMIKRLAKVGKNAGKEFYGCATFPRCRGTIDMQDVILKNNKERVKKMQKAHEETAESTLTFGPSIVITDDSNPPF